MPIADLVQVSAVFPALRATSAKQMQQVLARHASQLSGIAVPKLLGALQQTQLAGTTTLGNGIALPHGRVAGLGRAFALFAKLEAPLDMAALDGRKVDLVAMLFSPEGNDGQHLQALAALTRVLRNKSAGDTLRGCKDAAALFAVLTATTTRKAA